MKRIYIAILSVTIFALTGCSSNNSSSNETTGRNANNTNNNYTGNSSNNVVNGIENAAMDVGNGARNVARNTETEIGNIAGNAENSSNHSTNQIAPRSLNSGNGSNSIATTEQSYMMSHFNNNNTDNSTNQNSNSSSDLSQKANIMAKKLNSISGVERTTVLLTGDTAIIGLNLSDNLNSTQITEVKKQAEKTAIDSGNVKRAAVTASPDIVSSISNLANDIQSGKPISGLADELNNIIRKITPTV